MIINFIIKNVKKLLDILILVAIVVIIFLWNPFGIFGGGKKIQPTANMVNHIQEIGQLVTAEYYGEVISSLDEARLDLLTEDSVNLDADKLFVNTKMILFEVYMYDTLSRKEKNIIYEASKKEKETDKLGHFETRRLFLDDASKRNIELKFNYFKTGFKNYKNGDTLKCLICFLAKERLGEKIKKDIKKEYNSHRDDVLYSLITEIKQKYRTLKPDEFNDFLNEGLTYTNKFSDFLYEYYEKGLPRNEKKKELAMIGRGWVKAGIDFKKLTDNNFYFDRDKGMVHFFGVKTEILYKDINPWFIPQRKIPGYQIIVSNRLVGFEDSKKVKEYCIRKLEDYAIKADIIAQAKENAIETLKGFFSLISGTNVTLIIFHEDDLDNRLKAIAQDKMISYDEAQVIDSITRKEISEIKTLENDSTYSLGYSEKKKQILKSFLANIQKLPYNYEGRKIQFNFYTNTLIRIKQDSLLDDKEISTIRNLRWAVVEKGADGKDGNQFKLPQNIENQVWFASASKFMENYNQLLSDVTNKKEIKHLSITPKGETRNNISITKLKMARDSGNISELSLEGDSIFYNQLKKENINDSLFNNYYYNIKYNLNAINNLIENDSIEISRNSNTLKQTILNDKFASSNPETFKGNLKVEFDALYNFILLKRNNLYPNDNIASKSLAKIKRKLKLEKEKIAAEIKNL